VSPYGDAMRKPNRALVLGAHLHTFRVIANRPLPMAVALARLPMQVPPVLTALRVARGH
jgi:hypothetical protein